MESAWKKFDTVNEAHDFLLKTIEKIEKKKSQRIVGKKPAQYVIECARCGKPTIFAFTGIQYKKKEFICFECLSKE